MPNQANKRSRIATHVDAVRPEFEGELWAVPVPRRGVCPLVITRGLRKSADVDLVYAYLQPKLYDTAPNPDAIGSPETWGMTWLGLISTTPLRKGRWTRCGPLPGFDPAHWPVPPARHSVVNECEPVELWGQHPWGEMWSVETTGDEPTMTIVSNTAATREEALQFPKTQVVTAASQLEKSLVDYFAGRKSSFWDMPLILNKTSKDLFQHWEQHAQRVRSSPDAVLPPMLPAGKKTDRGLKAGMWMGLPLTGGGFGAALLVEKPPKHLRFMADAVVMAMRRRWDRWPRLEDLSMLTPADVVLVAQTSMICVRDGRWRVLGAQSDFDPQAWVWPLPFAQTPEGKKSGQVSVSTSQGVIVVSVDPDILNLDPLAGQRCSGMSSYGAIEADAPRIMAGTHWCQTGASESKEAIVNPTHFAAWRRINDAIRDAIVRNGGKSPA